MLKQRQDALSQYQDANRQDLADQEAFEIALIREFLPEPLADDALDEIIYNAINESGAETMKDMGKVMALIKPIVTGRADMGAVSQKVKSRLT